MTTFGPVLVFSGSSEDEQLVEIDENLMRTELSVLERGRAVCQTRGDIAVYFIDLEVPYIDRTKRHRCWQWS